MKKSYMEEAFLANVTGADVFKIIVAGIKDIHQTIHREIIEQYDIVDLPIIVAVLEAIAQGLRGATDESGNELADKIKSHINVVTVDGEELQRQMRGETNDR